MTHNNSRKKYYTNIFFLYTAQCLLYDKVLHKLLCQLNMSRSFVTWSDCFETDLMEAFADASVKGDALALDSGNILSMRGDGRLFWSAHRTLLMRWSEGCNLHCDLLSRALVCAIIGDIVPQATGLIFPSEELVIVPLATPAWASELLSPPLDASPQQELSKGHGVLADVSSASSEGSKVQ